MNDFSQIFDSLQINLDPLNFIGVFIGIIISIYISKSESPLPFVKEQHERLISPLFNLIEPILFQTANPQIISEAFAVIEQNKSFADGKLLSLCYYYQTNPNHENYMNFCDYIDRSYDNSCRKLGLKRRPLSYRFFRHQYKSPLFLLRFFGTHIIFFLITLLIWLIMVTCILSAYKTIYNSANESEKMIIMLITCIFLLIAYRYIIKHIG